MKRLFYLLTLFLLTGNLVSAQAVCGFDTNNRIFTKTFPEAAKSMRNNDSKIKRMTDRGISFRETQQPVNIPVVVHILHTGDTVGSSYNPSDEKIMDAIEYLNEIYSGTHSSLTPAGTDAAGDIGIRFVLAKRDPDCNPTNGIRRINMSEDAFYIENGALNADIEYDMALKTPIAWDISRYYNIYVVNKINGNDGSQGQFIAGFAYFPVNHIVDGTVILASEMRRGSKTFVHEIGHAFNLYHPFEGSTHREECPAGEGDHVDDTDPISMNSNDGVINFECRSGLNPCNNNQPYSIRTENNIMNYTACYSLFTPGQKARMNASLLLEERASLVTSNALLPTFDGGGEACDPKINFEEDEVVLPVSMVQTTGCRDYKDFTFYVNISNTPASSSTVTLYPDEDSNAMEKVDFDFVGGNRVIFPAGSRQRKPFTIRIYDVGQRETAQKLALNFTVQGGSTLKGTAIPVMHIWLKPNDTRPVIDKSEKHITVGKEEMFILDANLFNAALKHQKSMIQYNRAEMAAAGLKAGNINGMQLFLTKNSTRPFKKLIIKLMHSTAAMLVKDGDITPSGAGQQVFSRASYTTQDGMNEFIFDKPFTWNGRDNIRIEACFDNGTEEEEEGNDYLTGYSDNSGYETSNLLTSVLSCSARLTAFSNYGDGIKPMIVFTQVAAGNPVANTPGATRQKYLGPYGKIFFYDNSNPKRVIASIKNLTDWNYGCVKVEIDRGGDRAFPFWTLDPAYFVTEKTFLITPQYANKNGVFEVSLYYTASEKAGYEQVTNGNWNNIQVLKTGGIAAGTINPLNRQQNKVDFNNVLHETFGNDYVITSTFSTGIENVTGFTSGVISSALPVDWVNFKGDTRESYTALTWTTENEINTSYFEVEVSKDGILFESLDTINAGNQTGVHSNSYNHLNPGSGTLYYRIKQVDNDLKYTYSNVIRLRRNGAGAPSIFPVPAGNSITIDFGRPVSNTRIQILTGDLRIVHTEVVNGPVQAQTISVAKLPAGFYSVRIISDRDVYALRFVKY